MKNFFQRFPDLCNNIFDQLDDQNLAKSKKVSVTWCSFINSEKNWWIRMIRKYVDEDIIEDPNIWRKVIVRTQIEIVKNFAIASRQFYKHFQKGNHWSPVHIAAFSGDLLLNMQISEKLKMNDPKSKSGSTPFHSAASGGNTEIYHYLMKDVKEKNPADNHGYTPLYIAAHIGHFEICKLIIDNVDNKNPAINGGFTPLYIGGRP